MPSLPSALPGRLATLIEQTLDACVELDLSGVIVSANPATARLVDQPADTLPGRPLARLVRAEQRPALEAVLARLASGDSTSEVLDAAVGRAPTWLNLRLTAVQGDHGRPLGVVAVGREVTAQVTRATEAARQADRLRLLHAVTAPTPEPADVRIRRALRLTAEMLGQDAGLLSHIEGETFTIRVVHAPAHAFAPGDTLPLAETYCSIAIAADGFATPHMGAGEHRTHASYLAHGFESYAGVPVRGADGLEGSLCVFGDAPRAEPFSDADLDLLRVLAAWAAATLEQEQQQRALAEGDALVRGLYHAAPLLMGVVELVAGADGLPVDVRHRSDNGAAADFFGTTPEAMRDQTASGLGVPPATLDRWLDAYRRADATGRPVRFEASHDTPDGERVLAVTVTRVAVADADRPARFCYVAEDVTEARHAEHTLARSERRLRVLSEATFEGLAFSRGGRVLDANAQFLDLLGLASVDEAVGREAASFVAPEHVARVAAHIGAGSAEPYEAQVVRRDGSRFWAEVQGREYPAYDDTGSVRVTAIRDATRRKAAEEQVRFQSDVLAHVSDAVVAVDLDGRITYWNGGAERLHGHAASDVIGQPLHEVVRYTLPADEAHRDTEQPVDDPFGALWQAVGASGDLYCDGPRGRRVVSVLASVLADEDGRETGLMAVARDVTAQRRLAERLRHQAHHDALTGLPNRIALRRRVERHLAAGAPFGLLFVDLDRFKWVNDTLGHDAGDRLLVAVAERMTGAIAPGDAVARLGGDEFAVLVEGPGDRAHEVAQRLLRRLEAPVMLDGRPVVPAASVGVVPDGRRYDSSEALLRDADTAMYDAKRTGRARASVFDDAMHDAAAARFETEADLRAAIAGEQFRLCLQPIVELEAATVVGVEALVRWEHPTRGLLAPAAFVPLAEDLGLIAEIDAWVLDATCREIGTWGDDRPRLLMVSVNCSDQAVLASGLAGRARRASDAAGLAPACLTLELTERVLVDAPAALAAVAELRRHGFQFSIDDFGTGFSSLGLLHRLPADGLKIDRSFVADLEHSDAARAIVRAIVRLADDLGLRVVAEGIETEGQWRWLRDLGCRYGQGYLFARPLAPARARAVVGRSLAPSSS